MYVCTYVYLFTIVYKYVCRHGKVKPINIDDLAKYNTKL